MGIVELCSCFASCCQCLQCLQCLQEEGGDLRQGIDSWPWPATLSRVASASPQGSPGLSWALLGSPGLSSPPISVRQGAHFVQRPPALCEVEVSVQLPPKQKDADHCLKSRV